MRLGKEPLHRVGASFGVAAVCLYLPFAWLLVMDYPWSAYRLSWLKLWPILPGFVAGALPGPLLYSSHLPYELETMAGATLLLLVGLTWLGTRGPRAGMAAAGIALLVAVPSSAIAYAVFRA